MRSYGDHYVDNKKLLQAFVDWKAAIRLAETLGLKKPRMPEYIGQCIMDIAIHLSSKPNFAGYSFKEDMIGEGILNVIQYAENFDPAISSSPFSYLTQIIYYAFVRCIGIEKKELLTKYYAIAEADKRGTFQEWSKRTGNDVDSDGVPNAYAGYLRLSSSDIMNFEMSKQKKKPAPKKKCEPTGLEVYLTNN